MTVSSVRHRRLIQELKQNREDAGYTQEEVAAELDWSKSKQFKLESGAIPVKVSDVRAMCDLYGVTGERQETLLRLARDARQKGWWHGLGDAIPTWFEVFVALENEASSLLAYQSEMVGGQLQTSEYARAVMLAYNPDLSEEEIARRIEVRRTRQARLTDPEPLELNVVLNEAVLRRPPGDPSVMVGQLRHLLDVMELPNVNLAALPFSAGLHPAMDGPFIIVGFPKSAEMDVVYLESQAGSLYLEEPSQIARYHRVHRQLSEWALDAAGTKTLLMQVIKDY